MSGALLRIKYVKMTLTTQVNKIVKVAFSNKFLLFTNISISFCLSGAGDVIEQRFEKLANDLDKWDSKRTWNMSATGIAVGAVCHYWYKFLDRRLPGHTIRVVINKILLDQFIGSPCCIFTFFGTLAILENTSYDEFVVELRNKWWKLYAAEWIVWPTAQFINFYFLPTKYRVLYDNTISLGYDVYTSHVANSDKHSKNK